MGQFADISQYTAAIEAADTAVAKKNIARQKLGGRVTCVQVDALAEPSAFLGKFDLIVSNPPYITTQEMEQLDDSRIRVMAGVTMTRAAVFAANLGLTGLEFAHGIPGSVGGAVVMNAGAYGGQLSDVCISARVLDPETGVITYGTEAGTVSFVAEYKFFKDLKAAVVQYGPQSPFVLAMLESLGKGKLIIPLDWESIAQAVLEGS